MTRLPVRRVGLPWIALLLIGLVLSGCTRLAVFDAVIAKDAGARLALRDAAFGPDARQRLDLYVPNGGAPAPLPVIVFFYGGSWNSGDKDGYSFVGRALASRGFVVAIADYRLLPQVRFPTFLEDGAAAVRWVRAHVRAQGGDPDRLVLMGHSAGAYNAAMLALDRQWLGPDRAAVRGLIGLAGPYDFLPLDGRIVVQAFGAAADPATTQPVNFVRPGDPPTFLATGSDDRVVRPANSDSLAARLGAAGVAVERRIYPGVSHSGLVLAIAKPLRGRAPVLDDLVAFARKVTGAP